MQKNKSIIEDNIIFDCRIMQNYAIEVYCRIMQNYAELCNKYIN
jgi:hypothetical protein